MPCHWWQTWATKKEEEVRVGSPSFNDQAWPTENSHCAHTRWQQKIQSSPFRSRNISWGSEAVARKTRIIDVMYNASNNELVRTKTLTKSTIVSIDATPFRQWYEAHYALPLGRKKGLKMTEADEAQLNKKRSKKCLEKYVERRKNAKVDARLEDFFGSGRVYARIGSSPGQVGRCDGYILEGKELEFYQRKMK